MPRQDTRGAIRTGASKFTRSALPSSLGREPIEPPAAGKAGVGDQDVHLARLLDQPLGRALLGEVADRRRGDRRREARRRDRRARRLARGQHQLPPRAASACGDRPAEAAGGPGEQHASCRRSPRPATYRPGQPARNPAGALRALADGSGRRIAAARIVGVAADVGAGSGARPGPCAPRACCRRARAATSRPPGWPTAPARLTDRPDRALQGLRVQAARLRPARRPRRAAAGDRDHPRRLRGARGHRRHRIRRHGGASATRSPRTGCSSSTSSAGPPPAAWRRSSVRPTSTTT